MLSTETVYYFGCLGTPGHFLHSPRETGRAGVQRAPEGFPAPWGSGFMPGAGLDGSLLDKRGGQEEGRVVLHHVDGWTALAFWDRSVDKRGGSNSVFVSRGTLTCAEMLDAARATWPQVFARFTFPVTCPPV
jgi:hypothetical protein